MLLSQLLNVIVKICMYLKTVSVGSAHSECDGNDILSGFFWQLTDGLSAVVCGVCHISVVQVRLSWILSCNVHYIYKTSVSILHIV